MRFFLLAVGMIFLGSGCAGRHKSVSAENPLDPNSPYMKGVSVLITDGDKGFPDFLAGVWRQEEPIQREFVFTADGYLESAVVGLASARLKSDLRAVMPLIEGGRGEFKCGPWRAEYSPQTRHLFVEIVINSFRLEVPTQGILEGSLREIFMGPVSEDGQRWDTVCISYPEYYVTTEGYEKYKLPIVGDFEEQEITFSKVR